MGAPRAGVVTCCFLLAISHQAPGQELLRIPNQQSCASCRITLERVLTLSGSGPDSSLLGLPFSVSMNDGREYVVSHYTGQSALVFSARGELLHEVGRSGEGPGEFRLVNHVEISGDTTWLFDPVAFRMSVFGPDYELVATHRLPGQTMGAIRLRDGTFVVNALLQSPRQYGLPLHRLSKEGRLLSSFGGAGYVRPDAPFLWLRHVAKGAPGSLWSAYQNQYVLEQWGHDGSLLRRLTRSVPWFRPYLRRMWGGPDEPIDPALRAIGYQERSGHLMTIIHVPTQDWAERVPPPVMTRIGPIPPLVDGEGYVDSLIEIIDPDRGVLVASERFELELFGFASEDVVYGYRVDDAGVPFIDIWRVRVEQDDKGGIR